MTRHLSIVAVACLLAACQVQGAGTRPTVPGRVAASPGANKVLPTIAKLKGMDGTLIALSAAQLIGQDGNSLIGQDGNSLIGQDGNSLIGQDGNSLIGQDGNSLIGQDGNSLIGQDGNSLISRPGAGITGSVKAPAGIVAAGGGNYRLSAAAEQPLAGVHVYLQAADGRFFVGSDKRLLTVETDAEGRFSFKGLAALRGVRVFIPKTSVDSGLVALVPKDRAADAPVEVDAASTLTAQWIVTRVLANEKDKGKSLDSLTTKLEATARAQTRQAVVDALPAGFAELAGSTLGDAMERLRGADLFLANALEDVRRAMTLAGLNSNTNGLDARVIALQQPTDVAVAPDGTLYVVEYLGNLVRRVDRDGKSTIILGLGSPTSDRLGYLFPTDVAVGPDGNVYVATGTGGVYRVAPDGHTAEVVAGMGTAALAAGLPATSVHFGAIGALAFDAAGTLYFGEGDRTDLKGDGGLFALETDGTLRIVEPIAAGTEGSERREFLSLAFGADGTLWSLETLNNGILSFRAPGTTTWTRVATNLTLDHFSDMVPTPDGGVIVSSVARDGAGEFALKQYNRAGQATRIAGTGQSGGAREQVAALEATFGKPTGLARAADGTLYVTDFENGLVSALGVDGQLRVVVGRLVDIGDAIALETPLNVPGGVALDARGRIAVTEFGSHTVRRLDGEKLVTIAGGVPGFSPDGGRADKLNRPAGIAFAGEDLIVVDSGNGCIRRIQPDGTIRTIAGGGETGLDRELPLDTQFADARTPRLSGVLAVAVSPLDGTVWFTENQRIWRTTTAGGLQLVAGNRGLPDESMSQEFQASREGRPIRDVLVGRLVGLAFSATGELYAAEVTTCQIFKVDLAGLYHHVAGAGNLPTLAAVLDGSSAQEGEMDAKEATLLLPAGVAVDAAGNVYIAEMGTRAAQAANGAETVGLGALDPLNGRIRMVTPQGRIKTLAGLGGPAETLSEVRNPVGIAVDAQGRVVFVDNGTNQVKAL